MDAWDWLVANFIRITEVALLIIALIMIILGLSQMNKRIQNLEAKPIVPVQKACLDYTLREYREGEAPEKCAAEVYGDQFEQESIGV